jgi:hypothetical protein
MTPERQRLLELAMESLLLKKKLIEDEIASLTQELGKKSAVGEKKTAAVKAAPRKRFSQSERKKRSKRMKAYWENWRKQKAAAQAE